MVEIAWRVHIAAPIEQVYDVIATAEGRSRFWAESAAEEGGVIRFVFPDGTTHDARMAGAQRPSTFAVEYFGSVATFTLTAVAGGTDVEVVQPVAAADHAEINAGWVSVLLQLKAWVQFGVDLRNHDRRRSWAAGYADN